MPNGLHSWEITLDVYGPITVERPFNFSQRKDFHYRDRLYSDIEVIKNKRYGITITLTAFAMEQTIARKAALYFCGQALDVLSTTINLPTVLTLTNGNNYSPRIENDRRRLTEEELVDAFRTARLWVLAEPTFLRAAGWYRKGLYTEDPFDKFLAFYNTIETLCSKYNPNPEKCKGKSKCQVWETFKNIWGECSVWPIIPNQTGWIDDNYEMRVNIAHGIASIDINVIEDAISMIEPIKQVAYRLITDWRYQRLNPAITADIEAKLF